MSMEGRRKRQEGERIEAGKWMEFKRKFIQK
jgi:hypothetical protein